MEIIYDPAGAGGNAPRQFMKRLYPTRVVYRFLRDMLSSMSDMRIGRKAGLVSKEFSERIMLAVTEVNGCRYCSYFHTQVALKAGLDTDEINATLEGDFGNSPAEELPALLFAQHYAEQAGQPDPETLAKLVDTYGQARARAIIANIRAIMIGNASGNAFDALRFRLKGQPSGQTTLADELMTVFGLPLMMPVAAVQNLLSPRKQIKV
jgi:AhpD family alkylhydroperoxidase